MCLWSIACIISYSFMNSSVLFCIKYYTIQTHYVLVVNSLHNLVLLHELQGVVLHPFLAQTFDCYLVPHAIIISPDSLLNNSKLPLAKLLVNRDSICLDNMLRWNFNCTSTAKSFITKKKLFLSILFSPQEFPEFAGIIARTVFTEESFQPPTLRLGHSNVPEIFLNHIFKLRDIVHLENIFQPIIIMLEFSFLKELVQPWGSQFATHIQTVASKNKINFIKNPASPSSLLMF